MSTELTTGHEAEAWALRQRKAKALADSDLVPKEYRGNLPNVLIAIDMADRLNASPLMVMQNLVIVHGKPTWSATFMIATVNQSGRFSPLRYDVHIRDTTDALHNLAVQGPKSRELLSRMLWTAPVQPGIAELGWFRFTAARLGGRHSTGRCGDRGGVDQHPV